MRENLKSRTITIVPRKVAVSYWVEFRTRMGASVIACIIERTRISFQTDESALA